MNRLVWCFWAALLMSLASVGLGNLIVPGPWLTGLIVLVVVMALVGLGLQWLARRWPRGLQTVFVAVVLAAIAAWRTVFEMASSLMTAGLWPTRAAVDATAQSISYTVGQLFAAVPPVDAQPFACLAFCGLGAMTALVVAGAVVWRSAPIVIVGSLAPWGVVVSMRWNAGPTWPIVTGVAVLAFSIWHGAASRAIWPGTASRATQPVASRTTWSSTIPGVGVIAVALACTLLAMTAATDLPGWGSGQAWLRNIGQGVVPGGTRGIGVNGPIDVNASLLNPSQTPRLHVAGTYNGPLVVTTYLDFDGHQWNPAPPNATGQAYAVAAGSVLWDDATISQAVLTTQNTTLTFPGWAFSTVPLPTSRRTLTSWTDSDGVVGGGVYDSATDTLTADASPLHNQSVGFSVDVFDRTALESDHTAPPPNGAALAVPQTAHTADLLTLAQQLTAGANSDYAKLIAIQNYLRSDRFTYSLTPDNSAPSDDVVWDFLQRRTGYCVQFATAMIVLGRLAGLPMRAAAGYTTPSSGTGDVLDSNAHMWPQAYFARAGWVDFEPTPGDAGNAVPPPPTTSAPSVTPSNTLTNTPSAHTSSPSPPSASAAASASTPAASAASTLSFPWLGLLGGLAVVVALIVTVAARRVYTGKWTADRAWDAITRTGRRRSLLTPGATPGGVADRLGRLLPDDAKAQLDDLASTIERTRYAPEPAGLSRSRHWHDVQTAVLKGLRRGRRGA